MNIQLDKSGLYSSTETYDKNLMKFRMASDCEFENVTNFGLRLTMTDTIGIEKVTNIKFDNNRVNNAALFMNKILKAEFYSALQEMAENERDSLTICSVYDIESAGGMYGFMKSVEQGESELITPWLVILDMNPVYMPLARAIFTMSHSVGIHILSLADKTIGSRVGFSILQDPFCIQCYFESVAGAGV